MCISVLYGGEIAKRNVFYTLENNVFTAKLNHLIISSTNNNGTFNLLNKSTIISNFKDTITTGKECIVNCGSSCTVTVDEQSTVNTYHGTIITATGNNVTVIRQNHDNNKNDVFEVVTLNKGQTIQFNGINVKGYQVIEKLPEVKITIDGKEVTLSDDSVKSILSALK